MVEHLIKVSKNDVKFLNKVLDVIDYLHTIIENSDNINYKKVIELIKKIQNIKEKEIRDVKEYDKQRIRVTLDNAADILLDWAITKEVEKNK